MTDTLLQDFGRDGYVCVNPLYGTAEMDALNREIARFIRNVVPTMPDSQVYYEDKADKSSLKQLQMMFEYDSYFGDLLETAPSAALPKPCWPTRLCRSTSQREPRTTALRFSH